MSVWSTRLDLNDPAAFVHANPGDGYGRPLGPACGCSSHGLRYLAWLDWPSVATTARCAACARAMQQPPARP